MSSNLGTIIRGCCWFVCAVSIGCQSLSSRLDERSVAKTMEKAEEVTEPATSSESIREERIVAKPTGGAAKSDPPAPLPLSPSTKPSRKEAKLTALEVSSEKPQLENELDGIGHKLAAGCKEVGVDFRFEALHNPRPRIHHAADGHVYATDGLISRLQSKDELAVALAMEMAELIGERKVAGGELLADARPSANKSSSSSQGAPPAQMDPERPALPSEQDLDAIAQEILSKAGYRSANFAAIKAKQKRIESTDEIRPVDNAARLAN